MELTVGSGLSLSSWFVASILQAMDLDEAGGIAAKILNPIFSCETFKRVVGLIERKNNHVQEERVLKKATIFSQK